MHHTITQAKKKRKAIIKLRNKKIQTVKYTLTKNCLLENKVWGRAPRKELSQVFGQHFE